MQRTSPSLVMWLLLAAGLSVGGQVLIKMAISRIDGASALGLVDLTMRALQHGRLWAGLVMYGLSMLLFFKLLADATLIQVGLSLSVGYVMLIGLSWAFLGEKLDLTTGIGAALIIAGVVLVNRPV